MNLHDFLGICTQKNDNPARNCYIGFIFLFLGALWRQICYCQRADEIIIYLKFDMTLRTAGKPHKVKVVIPIYRDSLDELERKSLINNINVLKRYPVVFLLPEGTAAPAQTEGYDVIRICRDRLGTELGLAGYNRMMMSGDFYRLFDDCDYILICQTDAWIFRDELEAWCNKGYDYIGAPWPKRAVYNMFPINLWLKIRKLIFGRNSRPLRQDGFNRIGNGGLSLRRVESHIEACERYADRIEEFCKHRHHLYNEDFFWATVPREFRYPSVEEALGFSFDVKPALCYKLSGGKLPFGCHGWYKKRMYGFWRDFIR